MKYASTIQVKGKQFVVDTFEVGGHEFIVTGKFVRMVKAKAEWDVDIDNPKVVIQAIGSQKIKGDIFTFVQRLPHTEPHFNYIMETDNVAAIPITTYENWWKKQITQEARNKVRKAQKKGVIVRPVEFNDDFVQKIMEIYHETPLRQGVPFTHYKKRFDEIKRANATYIERAEFIGAYFENELIGFVKLVHSKGYTRIMGILGKQKHKNKAVMNALIASAVEVCADKKIPFFTYGKMIYGSKGIDSLARFKMENGFIQYTLPRYFIPVTTNGKIILALNLHKSLREILPKKLVLVFMRMRSLINEKVYGLMSKK